MAISQKLIDYIKIEMLKGASLEEIRRKLLRVGWKERIIEESFELAKRQIPLASAPIVNFKEHKAIEESVESKPYAIIFLITGIFFVILCIVGTATYFVFNDKKLGYVESSPAADIAENNMGQKDCGNNLECFIESSRTCEPSRVTYSYETDAFGIKKTTLIDYELKGLEADKCIFYMKVSTIDIKYSEELIKEMRDSGISQENIIKKEQVENIKADSLEGKYATCKIASNDLTNTLNIWKSDSSKVGTFSSKIQKYAKCEGNYFN